MRTIRVGIPMRAADGRGAIAGSYVSHLFNGKLLESSLAAFDCRLEWAFFKNGAELTEAVLRRDLEFAWHGDLPSIVCRAKGGETTMIGAAERNAEHYLVVRPGERNHGIAELSGKVIACPEGTVSHHLLTLLCDRSGIYREAIQQVDLTGLDAIGALGQGAVDAVFAGPWCLYGCDVGLLEVMWSSEEDVWGRSAAAMFAVGPQNASAPITSAVQDALRIGAQWAAREGNKGALLREWSMIGGTPELWGRAYAGCDFTKIFMPEVDAEFAGHYERRVLEASRAGIIDEPFDVKRWAGLTD